MLGGVRRRKPTKIITNELKALKISNDIINRPAKLIVIHDEK